MIDLARSQGLVVAEIGETYAIVVESTGELMVAGLELGEAWQLLVECPPDECAPVSRVGEPSLADSLQFAREWVRVQREGLRIGPPRVIEIDPSDWRPCAPDAPTAPAVFRGGPLNDQKHHVPAHGPALVRVTLEGTVHWYAHRPNTLRAYSYAGAP